LGGRTRFELATRRASITGAPVSPPVDLIVAHSVLSFLSAEDLLPLARFFSASLRPEGRLVMTTSLGQRSPPSDPQAFRQHVLAELAARKVELPDDEATFGSLLEAYAMGRGSRSSPFANRTEMLHWLETAGFTVETIQDLRRGTGYASGSAPTSRKTDGVLVVARKDALG
jgi:hypothetical protein